MLKNFMKSQVYTILSITLIWLVLCPLPSGSAAEFGTDVPYEEAVPAFLEAVTAATASVLNEEELEDVAAWHAANEERIEEFLNDLISVAILLEDSSDPDFVFDQYRAFIEKWSEVAQTYPHFEKVEPALVPLINELFAGLPELDPEFAHTANPMEPLFDQYQETEAANPWGLGSIWQLFTPEEETRVTSVKEVTRETTTAGVRKVRTVSRQATATEGDDVVFQETTENNEILERDVEYGNPTLIHDILEQLQQDGGDADLISSFGELVSLINERLQQSVDDEVTDECSFKYIYRKETMDINEECTDIIQNQQNIAEINEFDPFDQVNQVFLGFNKELSSNPPHTSPSYLGSNGYSVIDTRAAGYVQRDRLRALKEQLRRLKDRQRDLSRFYR